MKLVKPPLDLPWPLWHESARLLHFPILKNAHSSLSDRLKGKPFLFETYLRYEWPAGALSFAVLRDPFERYVSALAQVFRMGLVAPGQDWSQFVDGVAMWALDHQEPWVFRDGRRKVDRHFLPQSATVERMPKPRRFFRVERLEDLWNELARLGLEADGMMDWQKRTESEWVNYAVERLGVRPVRRAIERHYAADMGLWRPLVSA